MHSCHLAIKTCEIEDLIHRKTILAACQALSGSLRFLHQVLHYCALLQHHYPLRHGDGYRAVRNDHARERDFLDRRIDGQFIACVQVAGRFIEHQQLRILI